MVSVITISARRLRMMVWVHLMLQAKVKAAAVPAETLVVVQTMQRQTMILQRNMTMGVVSTAFQAARMRRLVTTMQTRQTTTAHAWLWTSAVYAAVTALPTALAIATATVLQQATTVMATA